MSPTFQPGWPGVGILLLRIATGAAFIAQGAAWLATWQHLGPLRPAIALLAIASGALVLTGYRTRLAAGAAVMVGVASLLSWVTVANVDLSLSKTSVGFASVVAAALVFMGPGALSVDARLFGRREIVIPRSKN